MTMSQRIFLLVLSTVFCTALRSQKIDHLTSFRSIKSDTYFRFNYENDFFAATDKNYTQGYNFELATPFFKQNPINYLIIKPKNSGVTYGIALEHIGFTPSDFVSPEIQFGDRPFAAAIMLKSFSIATDTLHKKRIAQSFSLGLIGPGAFGKEMQVEIHRATGNKTPGGWDNQIKNDVVLNYRLDYEKPVYRYTNFFAVNAQATVQLGTLFTNASFGLNTTIGLINLPFSSTKDRNGFQFYAYAQPILTAVGYDATLQGGLINRESPYTFKSSAIERFTGQFNYGLILKTRTLYFEYARTNLTREFDSGTSSKGGGFKIGFTF